MEYIAIFLYLIGIYNCIHLTENICALSGDEKESMPVVLIACSFWPIIATWYLLKRVYKFVKGKL